MRKLYITICILSFAYLSSYGINYTSTGGDWNISTTWTPNGIPTNADNVTILSGNVTMTAQSTASNITINSGATLTNNNTSNSLSVWGILTNNGTYAGSGKTGFRATGTIIAGNAGSYSNTGDFWFHATPQVITGTVNKAGGNFYVDVLFNGSVSTVTNQGHISLGGVGAIEVNGTAYTGTWTNDVGSYVEFQESGFTSASNFTVNTSALNDTVDYEGTGGYNTSNVSGNTYYTLIIGGAEKTMPSNSILTNLNVKSGGGFNINGKNLTVAGNWTNNGTIYNNTSTITFNGSSTLSGTSADPFANLTVSSGSTLNINGKNLALSGNWTNNGTITGNTGTITFSGTTSQTISGSGTSPFTNLTLSNSTGLTVAGTSTLTGTLNITVGNLNAGSSLLTLVSNASGTARIGSVPSASTLSGNFIIQRYITGTKTDYQCLSTPIKNMVLSVWDNDPGFYMSGIGGVHGNAGSYNSVYTINEPTDAYVAVTTTSYVLSPALGLYLYFGDGNTPMTSFSFASTGVPNYGSIAKVITYTNSPGGIGFNLIGNPYPSPILWSNFHSDNSSKVTSSFQIYDEKTGSWVSSNGTTVTNASSKLAANPNVITMCQGFECTPSAVGSTTVTFKETEKTSTDIPIVIQQGPASPDWIRMQLSNNVNTFSDGTVLQFVQNSSPAFNVNEDVQFRQSFESTAPELYTLSSDNQHLTVNQTPDDSDEMSVPLMAKGGLAATYTLSFEGINSLQKYDCVTLEDVTNNKIISLENTNSYNFQGSDPSKVNKFILHFKHLSENKTCISTANNSNLSDNVALSRSADGVFANFNFEQPQTAIISVYNVLGQKVISDETVDVYQNNVRLNIVPSNNIYLVVIHTNNQVITKKIYY